MRTMPRMVEQDKKPVKFTSRTEMVLVPVVVTDKQGRHVIGLTKDDFTVAEEGKEQKIATFEEVTAEPGRLQTVKTAPGEFTNQIKGSESPRSLTIIALDVVNTPFLDQKRMREELIKSIHNYVDASQLTTVLMIRNGGVRVIHPFTSDSQVLVQALRKVNSEFHLMQGVDDPAFIAPAASSAASTEAGMLSAFIDGGNEDFRNYRQAAALDATLQAFQYIAQAYAGIPGRKTLIWATGGFPFNIETETGMLMGSEPPMTTFEHAVKMLNDANIAVYPVDVRGLAPDGSSISAGVGFSSSVAPGSSARTGAVQYLDYQTSQNSGRTGTMEFLANATGGHAYYNRNDLANEYKEAAQEGVAYYLLGYYLDKKNPAPGWRKLKVKVRQDGMNIRARHGFYVSNATVDPDMTRQLDVFNASRSPLDYTAVPFSVRFEPTVADGGKRKVVFDVILPSSAVSIDETDGNHVDVDVAAVVRDKTAAAEAPGPNELNKRTTNFWQTINVRPQPEGLKQIQENGITYKNAVVVPPGEYVVRFVVRDNNTGKMGSLQAPITVN